jgi:hypothetical protein
VQKQRDQPIELIKLCIVDPQAAAALAMLERHLQA